MHASHLVYMHAEGLYLFALGILQARGHDLCALCISLCAEGLCFVCAVQRSGCLTA